MKKIKTFEDACKALKISTVLPEVSLLPESYQKSIIATYKLQVIAQAINGKWKPDWNNRGQCKYYPWFKYVPGSGFALDDYRCDDTVTNLGSRLVFQTEEQALYAGEQFIELYREMMDKE